MITPIVYAIPFFLALIGIELFFAWQLGVGFVFAIASRSILLRGLGSPILYLGRFEWERLAPLRRYAGGMLAIGVIASLNTQFDKLVVSNLFTTRDLGYYSLASMAGQLAYAATLPILIAALPHWTALHGKGRLAMGRIALHRLRRP